MFETFLFSFVKERDAEDVWTSVKDLALVCESKGALLRGWEISDLDD